MSLSLSMAVQWEHLGETQPRGACPCTVLPTSTTSVWTQDPTCCSLWQQGEWRCCGVGGLQQTSVPGLQRVCRYFSPCWQRQLPVINLELPFCTAVSSISPLFCVFPVSFLSLFRLIVFQLLEEMQKNGMFNFNLGNRLGSSLVSSLLSIRFSQG